MEEFTLPLTINMEAIWAVTPGIRGQALYSIINEKNCLEGLFYGSSCWKKFAELFMFLLTH